MIDRVSGTPPTRRPRYLLRAGCAGNAGDRAGMPTRGSRGCRRGHADDGATARASRRSGWPPRRGAGRARSSPPRRPAPGSAGSCRRAGRHRSRS
ncbi:hypothetical protein E3O23_03350 [Cryobacterium tagatosivorans]|uniref:Uncharacterized protein n=1 Tax=Cryobacterium tagatosivorans TaxID=1259199 RepID=A0A4R8UJP5_9MICO|nr:hypothetical protein E3O23_03350 [Cryobacterium tagatosivorans]